MANTYLLHSQVLSMYMSGEAGDVRERYLRSVFERNMNIMMLLTVAETMAAEIVFSFAPFMVADFEIVPRNRVGYLAGTISAAYGLAQVFSAPVWGRLSDRVGRRPVACVCSLLSALLMLVFGFSANIGEAISFRLLHGIVSGNASLVKAVIGDLTTPPSMTPLTSKAWSRWGLAFGLGRVLAAAVGGLLSRPHLHMPSLFSSDSIFATQPYVIVS